MIQMIQPSSDRVYFSEVVVEGSAVLMQLVKDGHSIRVDEKAPAF